MGRYSNRTDQGKRIQQVVKSAPKSTIKPKIRTTRKTARRLDPDQVDALVDAYRDGATVYELARRFAVHRSTVAIVVERRGVSRRHGLLNHDRLLEAGDLFAAGNPLAEVGEVLGVSRSTVALNLRKEGVQLRR